MADVQTIDLPLAGRDAKPHDAAGRAAPGKPKFAYVDCLRGYAVLMVIICHTTYAVPLLPYPVHRLGVFGWHGVQLFFLASCVTLMMSASYERDRNGRMDAVNFFIRRFLRIAPMYYLAAAFYWLIDPAKDASLPQLLASLLFVNAWHPVTTSTTGAWQVVPGGWSIGVEFTFYFLFPLFVSVVTGFRRAVLVLILAVIAGAALNSVLMAPLTARFDAGAADNFLYFWFLNQAPVFLLGSMAFFAIRGLETSSGQVWKARLRNHGDKLAIFSLGLLLLVAMAPLPFSHELLLRPAVPQFLAASGAFVIFIVAMSQSRSRILINPFIASIGKVSFSAYLLHFAVLELVLGKHADFFHLSASGWPAIGVYAGCVAVVTAVTCAASALTYAVIEKPMMQLAKKLTRRRIALAAAPA